MDTSRLYIDGQWTEPRSGETMDVVDPSTEAVAGRVPSGSKEDVDRAVRAAVEAFPRWCKRPLAERLEVLERALEALKEGTDAVAAATTTEMGAPTTLARDTMTKGAIEAFASAIAVARDYPYERREGDSLVVRDAYGVTGAITPWNNPIYMMMLKVAPALAAGCTVVHKPAEVSSLSCFLVARMLHEAGLPPGAYNLVTGRGDVAGNALDEHPCVDLVSFTGSTEAGRKVAALAAKTPKRAVLELGGKSAALVLDDADLEKAIDDVAKSAFNNAGQMCGAWTRLLVPRAMLRRATEMMVARARALVVGDPRDPRTQIGPIASAKQQKTILDYIEAGAAEGAMLACGGATRPTGVPSKGYYVTPTVFTEVDNAMKIAREEIFGPVLCILAHDGDEDAVAMANDSPYGLRGAVFSADPARALDVARHLRTGQVDLNGYKMGVATPFGGYKLSGYGRCQGVIGYEEYLQIKAIQL